MCKKCQAIQKIFLYIISMRIYRTAVRSWHPGRDISTISCQAWRLLLAGNLWHTWVRSLLISGFIQWRSTLASCLTKRCSFYACLNWMGSFVSLNLRKISDCRSFSDLKIVTGSRPKKILSVTNHGLFTIYMEKPVGRWFVQMESKIPILEISVWGGVYHLNNRPNLPKEPRATLTSSKWRLKSLYSTRL